MYKMLYISEPFPLTVSCRSYHAAGDTHRIEMLLHAREISERHQAS